MNKAVKIYLIPLGLSLILYNFILKNKETELSKLLKSIPFIEQQKNKIFQDVGIELGKVVLSYLVISRFIK